MIEFLQECVNYVNLPATLLMIGVLLYWVMVMVGVFGMDAVDLDFDMDADVGLDADVGIDADVGVDGGVDGAPATSFSGSSTTGNEGIFKQVFDFFYLGEVPIVIIGTFFALALWVATIMTNHWYNQDQRLLISLLWLIPNLIFSLVVTRISMIPFIQIFKRPPPENKTREEMYGLIGRVTTSEVTDKFGQIEVKPDNEPEMILNVRTQAGEKLAKGDAAKIVSYNHDNGTFFVELTKWEKKTDG